jgi:hypothetical protein
MTARARNSVGLSRARLEFSPSNVARMWRDDVRCFRELYNLQQQTNDTKTH